MDITLPCYYYIPFDLTLLLSRVKLFKNTRRLRKNGHSQTLLIFYLFSKCINEMRQIFYERCTIQFHDKM